jgi:hypothetical protein
LPLQRFLRVEARQAPRRLRGAEPTTWA